MFRSADAYRQRRADTFRTVDVCRHRKDYLPITALLQHHRRAIRHDCIEETALVQNTEDDYISKPSDFRGGWKTKGERRPYARDSGQHYQHSVSREAFFVAISADGEVSTRDSIHVWSSC